MDDGERRVLGDHRRRKSKLLPPLAELPVEMVDWQGIYLPENLWLGYLLHEYGLRRAATHHDQVCDLADRIVAATGPPFLGYVSDFVLSADERSRFNAALDEIAPDAIGGDFRSLLLLYPECPAVWLARGDGNTMSATLGLLRDLVGILRDSHGTIASECRMLAFRRMLIKQKLHFPPDVPDEDLKEVFVRYPNVSDDEARHAQQFARVTMNAVLAPREFGGWGSHFWHMNFDLARCR